MLVWLVMWAMGARAVYHEIAASPHLEPFKIVWLLFWTIGGTLAIGMWLWMAAGYELVTLQPSALSLRREILGIGWNREFELTHIDRLRLNTEPHPRRSKPTPPGRVAFAYGAKTYRFAQGVDEAEARMIIDELRARHPFSTY